MKIFLTTALLAFSAYAAQAEIFVVSNFYAKVGTYDSLTGAAINANLITGLSNPFGITLAGGAAYVQNNAPSSTNKYTLAGAPLAIPFIPDFGGDLNITGDDVFVQTFSNTIGKYTASGAAVNISYIMGLNNPQDILRIDNTLYITNFGNGTVSTYDANTGIVIAASFITGLSGPTALAYLGNTLYVANFSTNTIATYRVDTGVLINASLISGLSAPLDMTLFGGYLYVANRNSGKIGKYVASTGVAVSAALASVPDPTGIAVAFDKSTAIDLGAITDTSADYTIPDRTTLVNIPTANTVVWYKFTIPTGADGVTVKYLDIATMPTEPSTLNNDDTMLGLYDKDGLLVRSDDDSGVGVGGSYSQLSFSANIGDRGPLTAVGFANAAVAKGQADTLPAGTYYLAVAPYHTYFKATEFDAGSIATDTGSFHLEFRTDIPAPAVPSTSTPSNLAPAVAAKSIKPTTKARLKITGTATDPDGGALQVYVKVGSTKAHSAKVSGAKWTFKAKLKVGKNRVQIYAVDPAGLRSPLRKLTILRQP